jgi:hypothetical protein
VLVRVDLCAFRRQGTVLGVVEEAVGMVERLERRVIAQDGLPSEELTDEDELFSVENLIVADQLRAQIDYERERALQAEERALQAEERALQAEERAETERERALQAEERADALRRWLDAHGIPFEDD